MNKLFPVARKEQQHMTALMFAAQYGDVEMVKQLVAAGADAAAANGRGSTALHYCAFSYNVGQRGEVVGVLVAAGAAVDARDKRGCTPLHCAVGYRSLEVVEELLRRGAGCVLGVRSEAGRTPLDMLTVKPVRLSPEVKVGREGADGRIREILMAAGATE